MPHYIFTVIILLHTVLLSAQTDDLAGYWENENGVGANWGQWKDKIWFISITKDWKEFFEGKVMDSNKIQGRLVKINLHTWKRYEMPLEMVNSESQELTITTPLAEDNSFTTTQRLHHKGFYSYYENLSQPLFDEKYRAWEVKSWFQDGDTVVTVFYDYGHKSHVDKGVFITKDSLQTLRYLSANHNTCFTREILHFKLKSDGVIWAKLRDIDGTCEHSRAYAREGRSTLRHIESGHLPYHDRYINIQEVIIPSNLIDLHLSTKTIIENFEINGKPGSFNADTFQTNPLIINNKQQLIFRFGKSYNESNLHFQLEGYDATWLPVPPDYRVTYAHLPLGDYLFKITTNLQHPEAPHNTITFRLRVVKPFYLQEWFYVLLTLGIILIIGFVFWWRERQRRNQEQLRRHIARELHDDIGSTLSSISILTEAAKRRNQGGVAKLDAIGKKAREALDNIGDIVWSMNTKQVSTEAMLQRMKEFALETLDAQNTIIHFATEDPIQSLTLQPKQRKDFYLIFKEAINNAAKYAQAQHLWVILEKLDKTIGLEIRDDGIGFDMETIKYGNGLRNMQARAERLGGVFTIKSEIGVGTTIHLSFPITS